MVSQPFDEDAWDVAMSALSWCAYDLCASNMAADKTGRLRADLLPPTGRPRDVAALVRAMVLVRGAWGKS